MNLRFFIIFLLAGGFTQSCFIEQRQPSLSPATGLNWKNMIEQNSQPIKIYPPFRISATRRELIPDTPSSLTGFGGIWRRWLPPNPRSSSDNASSAVFCKPFTEIIAPPRIKIQWLQGKNQEGNTANRVHVNLDLVATTGDLSIRVINLFKQLFPNESMNVGNVTVMATHTHSGPAGLSTNLILSMTGCDTYSPTMWNTFERLIISAAKEAYASLQEVKNKKFFLGDASDFLKSRLDGMAVDTTFTYEAFETMDKTICRFIVGLHPIAFSQTQTILSGDLARLIEDAWLEQGKTCAFENGVGGNSVAKNLTDDKPLFAKMLVKHAIQEINNQPSKNSEFGLQPFTLGNIMLKVPKPRANLSACSALFEKGMTADLLGLSAFSESTILTIEVYDSEIFIYLPFELTYTLSQQWKNALEKIDVLSRKIVFVSLSNDYLGYFVDKSTNSQRHLESCQSLFDSNFSDEILGKMSELLKRLLN